MAAPVVFGRAKAECPVAHAGVAGFCHRGALWLMPDSCAADAVPVDRRSAGGLGPRSAFAFEPVIGRGLARSALVAGHYSLRARAAGDRVQRGPAGPGPASSRSRRSRAAALAARSRAHPLRRRHSGVDAGLRSVSAACRRSGGAGTSAGVAARHGLRASSACDPCRLAMLPVAHAFYDRRPGSFSVRST
jgi:hypothetical protein